MPEARQHFFLFFPEFLFLPVLSLLPHQLAVATVAGENLRSGLSKGVEKRAFS
jgi:hypothetical protein